jgi:hypothetical protein
MLSKYQEYKRKTILGLAVLVNGCGLTSPVSTTFDTAPAGDNPTISIRPADDIKKSSFNPVISTSVDAVAAGVCLDAATPSCTTSNYTQFTVPIYKTEKRAFFQYNGNMLVADGLAVTLLSQKADGTVSTRKLTFHCKSGSPVAGCGATTTATSTTSAPSTTSAVPASSTTTSGTQQQLPTTQTLAPVAGSTTGGGSTPSSASGGTPSSSSGGSTPPSSSSSAGAGAPAGGDSGGGGW